MRMYYVVVQVLGCIWEGDLDSVLGIDEMDNLDRRKCQINPSLPHLLLGPDMTSSLCLESLEHGRTCQDFFCLFRREC